MAAETPVVTMVGKTWDFHVTEVLRVSLKDGVHDGSSLARTLITEGYTLKMLKEEEVNLEDVFLAITKGVTN